ncbi:ATPase, T2SS/T4P/T4SS family [Dankookia sp. P2]|uniref:ATPase, T2SS/T4P/T4SS family n=1 Tax=Dankookia sp. P2 TaxID=3423955 RepID=UPI003D67A44B
MPGWPMAAASTSSFLRWRLTGRRSPSGNSARRVIDFDKLVEFGALTRPMAKALQVAARCRLNVVISGGTGSGKTTMLNALSRMIDQGERIVTVEDAAELQAAAAACGAAGDAAA